ncbi:hypothetical protein [Ornithinibacillus sp. JPR2-1]|uniref:hypothetical protein n=1 Tax=Ornithinibacillus sp. JPR2-1 TaxID=2094019 RepID=UPI0031D4B440
MLRDLLKTNKNEMYLNKKRVEIPKLTPEKWKKLFSKVDMIPGLVVQVMSAPKSDFYAYIVEALNLALDEVVEIVSVLTDIEVDYIRKNVGLDELLEYLQRTVKLNRLDTTVKNVKSLLPKRE